MEKVYYINKESSKDAVELAIAKALAIVAQSKSEYKSVLLLFSTYSVADEILDGVLPDDAIRNHRMHWDDPNCGLLIESVKTYNFSNKHILVPILVSEKELQKFEDEWAPRQWVVLPQSVSLMEKWLKVHSAVDVESKEMIRKEDDFALDNRVINGIEWLWATSYPNEGFTHPLDLNRLKCMANALAANHVELDYYAVLYYCITHQITHKGGRLIADGFVKAQSRKFKTDGNYTISFLTEMMNTKHARL